MRIVMNQRGVDAINALAAAEIGRRTEAIKDACNSESSWGGYESEVDVIDGEPVGRVWPIDESTNEARANRLLRNLDAR